MPIAAVQPAITIGLLGNILTPAAVAVPGGLHQAPPPPQDQTLPGAGTPPWTEWQTGVKILPCPKPRLRAAKILRRSFAPPFCIDSIAN